MGSGLAGLSTAVELLDQGYEVDIYETRPFVGGKVASYKVQREGKRQGPPQQQWQQQQQHASHGPA
mgnify:FL=1